MRIAQVAPLYEPVPPPRYGGTERVIAALCNGLVAAGHDVTLFAAATSDTAATLHPSGPQPLRSRMSREEMLEIAPHLHLKLLSDVYSRAGDFDVIHAHLDLLAMPFVSLVDTPTVLTLHGRLDTDVAQRVMPLYPDVPLVSISDFQRQPFSGVRLNWVGTVPNGLDLDAYQRAERTGDGYLAFVGRINHEKRPDMAIEIAVRNRRQLKIAAKVDPFDVEYYQHKIQPLLEHPLVDFLGEIGEEAKPDFFAGAAATLFPSDWPEPFGLVMIESMAAGTPVIALRRGSIPEVLVHGVTGFICDTFEEMAESVRHIDDIDPAACRAHALNFTGSEMSRRYMQVYRRLCGNDGMASATPLAHGVGGLAVRGARTQGLQDLTVD
ncbi:MAG: glycosyltransferase family 4 protein [Ilumatobacteraceae bacterium]